MSHVERDDAWLPLFELIRRKRPHCKMRDVRVVQGRVASYGSIQYTLALRHEADEREVLGPESFDQQWERLASLCRKLGQGVLKEVHFTDGRPVLVYMEDEGPKEVIHSGTGQARLDPS